METPTQRVEDVASGFQVGEVTKKERLDLSSTMSGCVRIMRQLMIGCTSLDEIYHRAAETDIDVLICALVASFDPTEHLRPFRAAYQTMAVQRGLDIYAEEPGGDLDEGRYKCASYHDIGWWQLHHYHELLHHPGKMASVTFPSEEYVEIHELPTLMDAEAALAEYQFDITYSAVVTAESRALISSCRREEWERILDGLAPEERLNWTRISVGPVATSSQRYGDNLKRDASIYEDWLKLTGKEMETKYKISKASLQSALKTYCSHHRLEVPRKKAGRKSE